MASRFAAMEKFGSNRRTADIPRASKTCDQAPVSANWKPHTLLQCSEAQPCANDVHWLCEARHQYENQEGSGTEDCNCRVLAIRVGHNSVWYFGYVANNPSWLMLMANPLLSWPWKLAGSPSVIWWALSFPALA